MGDSVGASGSGSFSDIVPISSADFFSHLLTDLFSL